MRSDCERLAPQLAAAGRGELDRDALEPHVGSCLRCRLELARYQRLFRILSQLAGDRAEVPPSLLSDVLDAIEAAAARTADRSALTARRVAYASAALGAAATGAIVLLRGRGDDRAVLAGS